MSISDIRFAVDGEKVVLQVLEPAPVTEYQTHFRSSVAAWRDAKVEDLLSVAEHLRSRYSDIKQESYGGTHMFGSVGCDKP